MRILVIGGNGFIGNPLVRELLQDGQRVAVLHRAAGGPSDAEIVPILGDRDSLRDSETEIRRFAPDVIVDMILSSGRQAEELTTVARRLCTRHFLAG